MAWLFLTHRIDLFKFIGLKQKKENIKNARPHAIGLRPTPSGPEGSSGQ